MNCGFRPNVGDKGQRYELRYYSVETGELKRFGWSKTADPSFLEVAASMPSGRDFHYVDRQEPGFIPFTEAAAAHKHAMNADAREVL